MKSVATEKADLLPYVSLFGLIYLVGIVLGALIVYTAVARSGNVSGDVMEVHNADLSIVGIVGLSAVIAVWKFVRDYERPLSKHERRLFGFFGLVAITVITLVLVALAYLFGFITGFTMQGDIWGVTLIVALGCYGVLRLVAAMSAKFA